MHSLAVSVLLAVPLLCLAWSDGAGSCDRVGHGKKADGSGGCSLRAEHTAAGTTDGATHIVTLACPTDFRGFVLSCRATQPGGGSEAAASLRPMAGSPVKAMNMHVSKSCAELSLAGFGAVTHTSPAPKRSVSAQLTLDGHASSPLELAAPPQQRRLEQRHHTQQRVRLRPARVRRGGRGGRVAQRLRREADGGERRGGSAKPALGVEERELQHAHVALEREEEVEQLALGGRARPDVAEESGYCCAARLARRRAEQRGRGRGISATVAAAAAVARSARAPHH
jgi:hypothetical protein